MHLDTKKIRVSQKNKEMNITIVGAGRVGVHLSKYFADEQQDVFLIDKDPQHLNELESDFNLRTYCGDPTDFETLREANSENADIFVAVTADPAQNIVACSMAKSMGARRTIARVDKFNYLVPSNQEVVKRMGVDNVVFPDYLAARSIISSLEHAWSKDWSEFEDGSIIMVAIDVREGSKFDGLHLKDLFRDSRILHISAMRRNHRTIIPHGDTRILAGDVLYVTVTPQGIGKVMELTGVSASPVRKVILLGGSMVSELIAGERHKNFSCTLIEKDRARCRRLMETCPDTDIICGDGSELDVLEEAGIGKCDAFVALTDNTESNILSCLTARDLGVGKNMAEVEKEQLIAKAESFNIDTIINKPIITANAIFQLILDADVDSSKCFVLPDAEVGRITVKAGSMLTKAKVMDLKLPDTLTLAGMIRNGQGEMVTGATQFQPDDIAIVFCLAGSLRKVEKLFGK